MPKEAQGKLRLKAIDSMSRVINKVKQKTLGMTNSVKKANVQFQLMRAKTRSLNRALSKTGAKFRRIGASITTFGTAPLLAFGFLALKTAAKFETSMNKVAALSGATGKPLKKLTDQAKDLGKKTQFSASAVADNQAFLAQAGFKANEILAATPAILDLAAASSTDLATAADIASNVMGAFNLKATQTGKVANVLALATARGNTNMIQLAEAMKDAGPVAKGAGASLAETSALIAKLGDAGIQGSKAGTTLKNMFLKLSSPTKGITKTLDALGVKTIDPNTKKLRSMTAILADLGKAFEGKGIKGAKRLAVINKIFGLRAVAGANVLLNTVKKVNKNGVNAIAELTTELDNATSSAKDMAATMVKGLPGAIFNLKSAFEGLQLAIFDVEFGGKKLKVIVEENINKLTKWIRKISNNTDGMLKWKLIIAGVIIVMGPLIGILGVGLALLPSIVTGLGFLSVAYGILKLKVLAFNLALIPQIALFALLAFAAFMVIKNWTAISGFLSDVWNNPIQQVKDLIGWVSDLIGLSKLFGFGDDTDEKLKAQGFKFKKPGGEELGTRGVVKESQDKKDRERKSLLDVNFSNIPLGTNIQADDKGDILGALNGRMTGAF